MMPSRTALLLGLGTALGVVFLVLAIWSLDWAAFAEEIRRAHFGQIALVLVCLFCYYGIKAERWKHLVSPFASASGRELQPAVVAGLAGNYVFPHFGEIARAVLAGRKLGTPTSALLGSIAIERFFDFLALLGIVLAILVPLGGVDDEIRMASFAAAAICAVLLACVMLFVFRTEACIGVARRMTAVFSGKFASLVARQLHHVRTGLGAPATLPLLRADIADAESMARLAARAKAIITTVGPYQLYGEPLVAACVQSGTDYVDLCGEPAWMAAMIPKYEAKAKESGARIVFSCGFDSIPFDCGVWFLQQEFIRRYGAPASRVRGRVRRMKGGASGGTIASGVATIEALGD